MVTGYRRRSFLATEVLIDDEESEGERTDDDREEGEFESGLAERIDVDCQIAVENVREQDDSRQKQRRERPEKDGVPRDEPTEASGGRVSGIL